MNEQDAPVAGDNGEPVLIDLRRRLLVALACTTPLLRLRSVRA
jgi:hypothetical protein